LLFEYTACGGWLDAQGTVHLHPLPPYLARGPGTGKPASTFHTRTLIPSSATGRGSERSNRGRNEFELPPLPQPATVAPVLVPALIDGPLLRRQRRSADESVELRLRTKMTMRMMTVRPRTLPLRLLPCESTATALATLRDMQLVVLSKIVAAAPTIAMHLLHQLQRLHLLRALDLYRAAQRSRSEQVRGSGGPAIAGTEQGLEQQQMCLRRLPPARQEHNPMLPVASAAPAADIVQATAQRRRMAAVPVAAQLLPAEPAQYEAGVGRPGLTAS
jgi:hypothetical protein